MLAPGGNFVGKLFQGPDFKKLTEQVRATFETAKTAKPASSRQISIEQYVIGKGFREAHDPLRARDRTVGRRRRRGRSQQAVEVLHRGGVAAYPTDSIYALGCAIEARDAIEKIYRAKGMHKNQRLALICPDLSTASRYGMFSQTAFRARAADLSRPVHARRAGDPRGAAHADRRASAAPSASASPATRSRRRSRKASAGRC